MDISMTNLAEAFKEIKGNHLLIELLYCVTGLFLVLVLNYLYAPTSEVYPNWIYFNETQRAVTILIFAYFLARICNEIGRFVLSFGLFCLKNDKRKYFKNRVRDLKECINNEVRTLDPERLNHAEIDDFIHNHSGIAFDFSRYKYSVLVKKIVLGFLVGLSFFYSPYVLILSLLLWLNTIFEIVMARERRIEVAAFYLKQRKTEV